MEKERVLLLARQLYRGNLKDQVFANLLEKNNEKIETNCSIISKHENTAYNILLSYISPEQKLDLKQLDNKIKSITNYVYRNTGWKISRQGASLLKNKYFVPRNNNGFYLNFNTDDTLKLLSEKKFYFSNDTELQIYHELMSKKEEILESAHLNPGNIYNSLIIELLCEYIGYSNQNIQKEKIK